MPINGLIKWSRSHFWMRHTTPYLTKRNTRTGDERAIIPVLSLRVGICPAIICYHMCLGGGAGWMANDGHGGMVQDS